MAEVDRAADQLRLNEFRWARWIFVVVGFLCMVTGVIVLADPKNSLATIAVVIGIFLVIDGIVGGIVFVSTPGIGVETLAVLAGIALILRGIAMSTMGWLMHHMARDSQLPARGRVAAT
jgi:uncharacterized membrane protein HdeD (DUF308 family)